MKTPSGLNGALSSGALDDGSIRREPITGEQLDSQFVGVVNQEPQRCRPDVTETESSRPARRMLKAEGLY